MGMRMNQEEASIFRELLHSDMFGWIIFCSFAIMFVFIRTVASVLKTRAREQTRREIAAYIAEGSLTPEQGERLLTVGRRDE